MLKSTDFDDIIRGCMNTRYCDQCPIYNVCSQTFSRSSLASFLMDCKTEAEKHEH